MAKFEYLTCPYGECRKGFEKPVMLTDFSKTPRETYYACPHCLTKVDVVVRNETLNSVSLETSESALGKSPSGCSFQFGYLKTVPSHAAIPDGCLTCSELLQCMVRKDESR